MITRTRYAAFGILIFLLTLHVALLGKMTEATKSLPQEDARERSLVLPSQLIKVLSLEFDGLVSDYLFFETMTYIGGHLRKDGSIILSKEEWYWIYNTLDVASDLDPYFIDPYYVANAYLTWDAGMVKEANQILEKGRKGRDWDWSLPFFMGFNEFFFLRNNERASSLLMESSKRPGAPSYIENLALKLSVQAGRIESSILFLEELLQREGDANLKKRYEMKVKTFRIMQVIERAVAEYRGRFGRVPKSLDDLVARRILSSIPKDPSGGEFFIDLEGRIRDSN